MAFQDNIAIHFFIREKLVMETASSFWSTKFILAVVYVHIILNTVDLI
jgi:hypothetical protein